MPPHARLPKIISVIFAIASILCILAAVLMAGIALDPKIHRGETVDLSLIDLEPQSDHVVLNVDKNGLAFAYSPHRGHAAPVLKADRDGPVFVVTGLKGKLDGALDVNRDLFLMVKRFVLPLGLLYSVFLAVLFDLLRRLFRNVACGQSFTTGSMRLVYAIGFSLIGYSLVSAAAESALMTLLADHIGRLLSFKEAGMRVVVNNAIDGSSGLGILVGNSAFFSGLLMLALAEVFRQGLKLKQDSDLTI